MLNMDFSQKVQVHTAAEPWVPSPRAGVWRKPLAREEQEHGHATSIVRYDPGASFHSHNHPGGEEILVLEGTFSDETGDFGRGSYFRNPAGFVHAPFSKEGCVILVKLHQFAEDDEARLCIPTETQEYQALSEGIEILPLHQHKSERASLLRMASGSRLPLEDFAGVEWYLLSGQLSDDLGDRLGDSGSWFRAPGQAAVTASEPSLLWLKTGHF